MSSINHLYFIKERKYYNKEIISDTGYLIEEIIPTIKTTKNNWKNLGWQLKKDKKGFQKHNLIINALKVVKQTYLLRIIRRFKNLKRPLINMKIIFIFLLMLTGNSLAFAQNPDNALANVHYNFIHITDTSQKELVHKENMILFIGKNASVYTSFDDINKSILRNKRMLEAAKTIDPGLVSIQVERKGLDTEGLAYFFYANENKLFTKERVYNTYLIEENAPKINWKITPDTASLSGIACQKATAFFLGRHWIAWFAPELPFNSGPWKLNGLPGLILEAYDVKKEVQFQFNGIERLINQIDNTAKLEPKLLDLDVSLMENRLIQLPLNAIKTTKQQLARLKKIRDNDPKGFMNAQMVSSGVKYNATSSSSSQTQRKKAIINNPIELPSPY